VKKLLQAVAPVIIFVAVASTPMPAEAGWARGFVSRIYAGPQLGDAIAFKVNTAYVFFDFYFYGYPSFSYPSYPREGRPACAIYDEFAFDASTPAGQRTYQLLLEASNGRRNVEVYGSGACTVTGDREDLRFFYICSEESCVPAPQ
jgi:hypothetical protein